MRTSHLAEWLTRGFIRFPELGSYNHHLEIYLRSAGQFDRVNTWSNIFQDLTPKSGRILRTFENRMHDSEEWCDYP